MTGRDRLIELFKKIEYTPFPKMTMKSNLGNQFTDYALNCIVDELLANGVVVLDTKIVTPQNRPLITQIAGMPINDVFDLLRTKKEGRLIVPPCKVGDVIYHLYPIQGIVAKKVKRIQYGSYGLMIADGNGAFHSDVIGKTVFLTKEEAEAELEKRGKENA